VGECGRKFESDVVIKKAKEYELLKHYNDSTPLYLQQIRHVVACFLPRFDFFAFGLEL
jgi:hypothetical protein